MNIFLKIISKGLFYATTLLVGFILLTRIGVNYLWGSHVFYGVLAAPFVLVFGIIGLMWLGNIMWNNIKKDIQKYDEQV